MSFSLKQMVDAALQQHAAGVKVASMQDAPTENPAQERFELALAEELGMLVPEGADKVASEIPAPAPEPSKTAGLDDDEISYSLKLADALTHAAGVVEKLAGLGQQPAIQPQPHVNSGTPEPAPQASAQARNLTAPKKPDANGNLPVDDQKPTSEGGATNHPGKTASDRARTERLLQTKVAEYRMLLGSGMTEAADQVLKEAQELKAKLAEGSLPVSAGEPSGTHVPDNAGMASLTKAQARDANTRGVSEHIQEPPKRDNAATANVEHSSGLKLSSLPVRALLGKADGALQAVGGKVLGGVRAAGRAAANAADNKLTTSYGAKPVTGTARKALEGVRKGGVQLATQTGGSAASKRLAGGATLGVGALGTGALAAGHRKEAAPVDLSKAKGLRRVGQLLTGSRAKNLENSVMRTSKRLDRARAGLSQEYKNFRRTNPDGPTAPELSAKLRRYGVTSNKARDHQGARLNALHDEKHQVAKARAIAAGTGAGAALGLGAGVLHHKKQEAAASSGGN